MTNTQIKNKSRDLFDEENYNELFKTLYTLGLDEFISFAIKEKNKSKYNKKQPNWLTVGECAHYFWTDFILESPRILELFSSKHQVNLLHQYFSQSKVFSKVFEYNLAKLYPEVYVEAIRKNQVFFKADRIDFICNEIELPEHLKIHQEVWALFQKQELDLFSVINSNIEEIKHQEWADIFCYVTKFVEQKRFQNKNAKIDSYLAEAYSFFMELYLSKVNTSSKEVSKDDLESVLMNAVHKPKESLSNKVYSTFEAIIQYKAIKNRFYDSYSFEKNVEPIKLNGALYFKSAPETFLKWEYDTFRYTLNQLVYAEKGIAIRDELIKTNSLKIPGETIEWRQKNEIMVAKQFTVYEALYDLGIEELYLSEKKKKPIKEIVDPLFSLASNRQIRYTDLINDINDLALDDFINKVKDKNILTDKWSYAYQYYILRDTIGKAQTPFFYDSIENYSSLNEFALNDELNEETEKDAKELTQNILEVFSKKLISKKFDRFNLQYNVFDDPFIIINKSVFTLNIFLAAFSDFYVYLNKALKNNHKKTAKKIESVVYDKLIENNKWNVLNPNDNNKVSGDADIILYDNYNVVLMQLKRTFVREDIENQYVEYVTLDLKAADQLNKVEKYFNEPNEVFEIGNRKVHKWIVSNSFEGNATVIDDCLKINYFNLLSTLKFQFKGLTSFITYFEKDSFHTNTNLLEEQKKAIGSVYDSKEYNLKYYVYDTQEHNNFYETLNEAFKFDANGNFETALNLFNKCIAIESKDAVLHGSIANTYANMKDYKNSFHHFEVALKLSPYDPFIVKNYIGAKMENHEFEEALKMCISLVKKYPYILELKAEFNTYFINIVKGRFAKDWVLMAKLMKEWEALIK